MDFERRAAKAYDRGDAVRAVILLVEGLKRRPDRRDAADALVDYYVEGLDSPGLERDVVSGLVETPEADLHLGRIYTRLHDRGREKMARDLQRAAQEHGYELEVEPPGGEPAPTEAAGASPPTDSSPDIETIESDAPESERVRERLRSTPSTVDETPSVASPMEGDAPSGEPGASDGGEGPGAETSTPDPSEPAGESEAEPEAAPSDTEEASQVREVEPRGPSGPAEESPAGEQRTWLRRAGLAVVIAAAVGAAGYLVWHRVQPLRAEQSLDARLTRLDPNQSFDFDSPGLSGRALEDRRDFVAAIRALERGETHAVSGDPTTGWGLSARALSALTRDDLEVAVRAATKLERTRPSDDLARIWTTGRVAEYRGRLESAAKQYRRGRVMFPEFVPFITGALRVAFVQFDRATVQRLVERLTTLSPDHPYGVLAEVDFPGTDGPSGGETAFEQHAPDQPQSRFIQSVNEYEQALGALYGGKFEGAIGHASGLIARREHFGPAIWVRAMARAALFDVAAADSDFERVVELSSLSRTYRWYLQWVAPTMLTAAGRPDLGAKYVVAGEGPIPVHPQPKGGESAEESSDQPETVVPRTTRWDGDGAEGESAEELERLKRAAELARVRVFLELGHHGQARRLLAGMRDDREKPERRLALLAAEVEARRGRRPAGPGEWARESASREARLVDAFYTGRFERAIELGRAYLDEAPTPDAVRYVALSYAATDRGRRALRTLEEADLSILARPAVDRIRARIVSRLWRRDAPETRGLARLETLEPTSTQATVDLAAVMLWKHHVEAAERWSGAAVERAPDFPEANWMRGLVLRLEDEGTSERYLARSWRADGDGARLSMELGYVNLGLDNYERARDLFYSALLAAPTSVEAIRGLGRSYHGFSPREGRWNFNSFLENYQGKASRRVQAAEVLRWLGVFNGVRDGETDGKEFLDRAVDRAGRRPGLLLELARFHEARGSYEDARRLYVDVLETDSTVAEAHLGLAQVAEATDDEATMRTHLKRYLDLQPAGRHAEWARSQLED